MNNKQVIITIAGPSTSGKSTLANLFKPNGFQEIVSTTTRPQRSGEIDGVHYNFVNLPTFNNMLADNQLVEHAQVGKYFYGVSKKSIENVLSSGNSAVLVLEPNGVIEVAKFCISKDLENYRVYINNPIDLLVKRLWERFKKDEKANLEVYLEREQNITIRELKEWTNKAYSGEHLYEQIFDTFNPENQEVILNEILINVKKKLNNNNKRKP